MESPSFKMQLVILALLVAGLLLAMDYVSPPPHRAVGTDTTQPAAVTSAAATSSEPLVTATTSAPQASSSAATSVALAKPTDQVQKPLPSPAASQNNPNEIHRIQNPYTTAPLGFETVNSISRSALVNIFCASTNGRLRPISGSGVIIDPKGIVLTNAHVAQYVLLAESGRVNMYCQIRTGSPAAAKWTPHVLYVPPVWVDEHAQDLTKEKPVGTGKYDYALLYVGASMDGSARPSVFPALSIDTRDAIGFIDDPVLAASYPAEFLGSIANSFDLYPVTSTTRIDELFTLSTGTVDVISIGSVIGAQSGSSGGGIVNAWGRLIGLITTTSSGATTGDRELRGITLSYISRDIAAQSGVSLTAILTNDPAQRAAEFTANTAPALVSKLLSQLR